MEKIKISELPTFDKVRNEDRLFSHVPSFGELGYIPSSLITSGGVAMRRWNVNNASPIGEAVGDIGFLRELPSLLGLGCYLVDRNHGRRKLDPNNHYKLATGEVAKLDGSMGDYMWGWGTKWYYACWTEGEFYYEAASLRPIRGRENYVVPVGSTAGTGQTVIDHETLELVSVVSDAPRYRGGNNDATRDGRANSQLGRGASNLPQATLGAYARKKGLGWEAFWYPFPAMTNALTRIIMGTRHLQTAFNPNKDTNGLYQGGLGIGVTDAGGWWGTEFNNYSFVPTSVGIELGDSCGGVSYDVPKEGGGIHQTVKIPVFFGLKNHYGLTNRWERGIIFSRDADGTAGVYVVPQLHSAYDVNSIAGLTKVATMPAGEGYIKQLSMQNLCHKPTVVGGSPSTFYADHFYNNNSPGLRGSAVGGHAAAHGGAAGPEYLHSNSAVSSANAYCGSPLCESEENWDTSPVIVG